MRSSIRASALGAALFCSFVTTLATAAVAQTAAATLSGTILNAGMPAANADVAVTGGNTTVRVTTDAHGRFRVPGLQIGTYVVTARLNGLSASQRVDLGASGDDVTVTVGALRQIGATAITGRPPVRGSGTDLTVNAETLARSPAGGNLPSLLLTLPGAARGANGVVHINGDHGDINYVVDGAPIPQELNRNVGSEFDAGDISFAQVLQGAYPAQYGERFASVIDISTRTGSGAPGFIGEATGGSYGTFDQTLGYHANLGSGNIVASVRNARSSRLLDPPNFDSPHDAGSSANQFLRYTQPVGRNFFNVTLSHTYRTYQIPADVANGAPSAIDDNETQDDFFATARFRHPIGDHGSFSFGPNYKRSRIRDLGDPANDFIFSIAKNPGAPGDCANALAPGSTLANPQPNAAVNYVNGSCAFSLFGDRIATDVGANADYDLSSAHHDVRVGALYDATHVDKTYAVALQPGNFLAPLLTPATPGAATTVTDTAPNVGHLTAYYLQDTWRMGNAWQLDYGVRGDLFSVASAEFARSFAQLSPRVKLTRLLGPRSSVYAYYGRFFTPFSLENVSPSVAYTLNLPLQAGNPAAFDLKPQRDSVYEIGGHTAVGRADLGVRIMQKNATDLIDDTQVGVTNLHQDINYAQGRIATQTAYYQLPLANAGRFSVSLTHTYSANRGCETQLLAPCFGAPNDWTPADHDQRYDVNSTLLINDRRGGWFSVDGEYGSGLSSAQNPNGGISCGGPTGNTGGPCKRTPHLTFDVEKGWGLPHGMAFTARVLNLFNDRYVVTYLNAQGTHYAPPRQFQLGLRLSTR